MHRNSFPAATSGIALCFLGVAILCLSACSSAADGTANATSLDPASRGELNRINTAIATRRMILTEDFVSLKNLRERYPNNSEIRQSFKNALLIRSDWSALETLLKNQTGELSASDRAMLGQVYVKLGRFADAVETLEPLSGKQPVDIEIQSLLAWSYYQVGNLTDAKAILNRNWTRIESEKRVSDMVLAGLVAIGNNDLEGAQKVLESAHRANSEDPSVTNVMAQLYSRRNDPANAEKFRVITVELNEKRSAEEARAGEIVQLTYELEAAWNRKDFAEVISKSSQLLKTSTDKNQRLILHQYLYEAHKGLGNQAEADRISGEIQKLKTQ